MLKKHAYNVRIGAHARGRSKEGASMRSWERLGVGGMACLIAGVALACDVCKIPAPQPPPPPALRTNPGFYSASRPSDTPALLVARLARHGVQGLRFRIAATALEYIDPVTNVSTYDWTIVDQTLALMAAVYPGRTLIVGHSPKAFVGDLSIPGLTSAEARRQLPLYLKDSLGHPGYAPNNRSSGRGNIAAATNATPVVITTAASAEVDNIIASHKVFIENSTGLTSINTFVEWGITGLSVNTQGTADKSDDVATFTLVGSAGNGAYTGGGKWTANPYYSIKWWDSAVVAKYIQFLQAFGTKYNDNPQMEGLYFGETAQGITNKTVAADAATGTPSYTVVYNADDYDALKYATAIKDTMVGCAEAFTKMHCFPSINFLQGDQTGNNAQAYLTTILLAAMNDPVFRAKHKNKVSYAQPDILPNNATLYKNTYSPYNVMLKWLGARSNSAENNSFADPACPPECIAQFAFRGKLGSTLVATNPANPGDATWVQRTQGLCLNYVYFFNEPVGNVWNANLIDGVIAAHPPSTWAQNCIGGGPP